MPNRLVTATIELETKRKALGAMLDTPTEQRSATFDADLVTAKSAVTGAQDVAIAAGLAEPEPVEHHGDNQNGRELRAMIDKASMGRFIGNIVNGDPLTGVESELRAHFQGDANTIPLAMLETRAGLQRSRVMSRQALSLSFLKYSQCPLRRGRAVQWSPYQQAKRSIQS